MCPSLRRFANLMLCGAVVGQCLAIRGVNTIEDHAERLLWDTHVTEFYGKGGSSTSVRIHISDCLRAWLLEGQGSVHFLCCPNSGLLRSSPFHFQTGVACSSLVHNSVGSILQVPPAQQAATNALLHKENIVDSHHSTLPSSLP